MSSTASLYVIRLADLPIVVAAGPDGAFEALQECGHEIEDAYFWSGHNLLFVIQHLWRSKGISLFSVAHQAEENLLNDDSGNAVIIVGAEHKPLLPQLDPSTHDPHDLVVGLAAWGVSAAEATLAVTDALTLLHEQITHLPDDHVLIIHVGWQER